MYQAYKTKTASLTENTASILKKKKKPSQNIASTYVSL